MPTLRRFLHLEHPRPARPASPSTPAGLEQRLEAVLDDRARRAAAGADGPGDGPPDGLPVLRWLRRRWW